MSAFFESCLELPVEGSLCNKNLGVTVHKFEDSYWVLWNKPELKTDLGRILTESELKALDASNFNAPGIGMVINIQNLNQRKEWFV